MKVKDLEFKVCGMKYSDNIGELLRIEPAMIGFIFYEASPRYVTKLPSGLAFKKTKRVGVFVNEKLKKIIQKVEDFGLDYIQLHGNETKKDCRKLRSLGLKVIKAFSVDASFNFNQTIPYEADCDLFLFDTKGIQPGGNGETFDWKILEKYEGSVPFLLSGGIRNGMQEKILNIKHPKFIGVDLNSGFEIAPALKNIRELQNFMYDLRNQ